MRATTRILALLLVPLALSAAAGAADEAAAIQAVMQSAHVGGIWTNGDEQAARAGFDQAFVMQVAREEGTLSVALDAWLGRLGLHGEALAENVSHQIEILDQTGDAAVARVRVEIDGKPKYTDHMGPYKTGDGWRIVAKTFHTHR